MRKTTRKPRTYNSSSTNLRRMKSSLEEIERGLVSAEMIARNSHFKGCERTLLHMISHVQTLKESLKSTRPGFA